MDIPRRQGVDEKDDTRNRQDCTNNIQLDWKTRPSTFAVFGGGWRAGQVVAQEQGQGGNLEGAFDDEAEPKDLVGRQSQMSTAPPSLTNPFPRYERGKKTTDNRAETVHGLVIKINAGQRGETNTKPVEPAAPHNAKALTRV